MHITQFAYIFEKYYCSEMLTIVHSDACKEVKPMLLLLCRQYKISWHGYYRTICQTLYLKQNCTYSKNKYVPSHPSYLNTDIYIIHNISLNSILRIFIVDTCHMLVSIHFAHQSLTVWTEEMEFHSTYSEIKSDVNTHKVLKVMLRKSFIVSAPLPLLNHQSLT